jgi:hypothetical protein
MMQKKSPPVKKSEMDPYASQVEANPGQAVNKIKGKKLGVQKRIRFS